MKWHRLENSDFKNFKIDELVNKSNNRVFYYIPEIYKKSFVAYLEDDFKDREQIREKLINLNKIALFREKNFSNKSINNVLMNLENEITYLTTKEDMSLYGLDLGLPTLIEYNFGFLKSKDGSIILDDGIEADDNEIELHIQNNVLLDSDEYIIAYQKNNTFGKFKEGIILTNKRIISIGSDFINIKWSEIKSYNRNFFNKATINGIGIGKVLDGIDKVIKSMIDYDYISLAIIVRSKTYLGYNEAFMIICRNKFNTSSNSINENLQNFKNEEAKRFLEIQLLDKNGNQIKRWNIDKKIVIIGRSSSKGEVDIDLKDIENGEYVSRNHGKIYKKNNEWYYVDTNSKYGTKLISNTDETMLATDIEYHLKDGDILLLADEVSLKIKLKNRKDVQ